MRGSGVTTIAHVSDLHLAPVPFPFGEGLKPALGWINWRRKPGAHDPALGLRVAAVVRAAKEAGVEVHAPSSHTLYDVERLLAKCPNGEPPTAYGTFLKIAASLGDPPKPVPTPETIPGTIPGDVAALVSQLGSCATGHGIPTLEELGYPALPRGEGFPAAGGETEGLRRLRATLAAPAYVAEFKKPNTSPTQMWQPADRAFASVKGAGSSGARPANGRR